MKELKDVAELNLTFQKHQQSMKSSPKRIQHHALDAVDPTSKIHAQNTQINIITHPRANHLQDKATKELITCKKFHNNRNNNNTFPTGTLSFQALLQIKCGNDI